MASSILNTPLGAPLKRRLNAFGRQRRSRVLRRVRLRSAMKPPIRSGNYTGKAPSIEELGVPVDDLGRSAGAVRAHDVAARPGEPVLECALEARSVQEPENALALRLALAHLALVAHARLVVVDPLPAQHAARDLALVAVAVGEDIGADALGLAVQEGGLDALAALGQVAALALQASLV